MINQNCIDVKHVGNLSVAYLTRFFGSAGPVVRVDKNQNSKYVTIEFANRAGVEKALRFDGRILDKEPIRIRMFKQKNPPGGGDCAITASSAGLSMRKKEQLGNFREGQRNTGRFKDDLWGIIFGEMRQCDFEENDKIANAMLLWRLGVLLMSASKHLQRFGVNPRGNYLIFQLEQQLNERLERKLLGAGRVQALRESRMQVREGQAWLWYSVAYPNTEEEQSKVEAYSAQYKCLQRIERNSAVVAHVIKGLYACSYIYAPEEATLQSIIDLQWEAAPNPEDNFEGIVQNIGARDIFYDLLGYQQPNSCLTLSENSDYPQLFECSLRLVGCLNATFEERGWCDIFEAVVWKRWTSATNYYFHIEIKQGSERAVMGQHNLFFEEGQFSCEAACQHYRKYLQLGISPQARLFYLRTQKPSLPNNNTFQQLYQDDMVNIQDEVEQQPQSEQPQESTFHEEVVVNICLIEIRQQGLPALNQMKLEHYLLEYIEQSITGKGLIVASQEMAYKLAANIIEREKEGRLFEFAHPRFEKQIGEELWRLYCKQNERKIRNNLVHYQLGKK